MSTRRRRLLSFAFALTATVAFALGVALRDTAQDWLDEKRAQADAQLLRSCIYQVVLVRPGEHECRRLMVYMELWHPLRTKQSTKGEQK